MSLQTDANTIIEKSIEDVLPDEACKAALENIDLGDRVHIIAIGKAAWQMAHAAAQTLGTKVIDGVVITKYHHCQGPIPRLEIFEAGHPTPDAAGIKATGQAIALARSLDETDCLLFLVSGGGSALFEDPMIDLADLQDINDQLLGCGASITEINTVRKHLSHVKGGRFAKIAQPARIYSIILNDIIGDYPSMIASGPTYPDTSTSTQALEILDKYGIEVGNDAIGALKTETPDDIDCDDTIICGSVSCLCESVAKHSQDLGYKAMILTDCLTCEAKEAGSFLGSIAKTHASASENLCLIAGGETVVHLRGTGIGGRNQEIALSAAKEIQGLDNVCVFSFGSDGTDGPCDAAGGYANGTTFARLQQEGYTADDVLRDNNSYEALKAVNGLIFTGATGTNVNDVSIILIKACN